MDQEQPVGGAAAIDIARYFKSNSMPWAANAGAYAAIPSDSSHCVRSFIERDHKYGTCPG